MSDDKAEPAHGLFGPGIFGTGIDVSALDEDTAFRLGQFMAEQVKLAEERGYQRAITAGIHARLGHAEQVPGLHYLLFDMERHMWWGPRRRGYTNILAEAGRYSQDEAVKIALDSSLGGLERATVIVADHGSAP